jgi:hypothetical protein
MRFERVAGPHHSRRNENEPVTSPRAYWVGRVFAKWSARLRMRSADLPGKRVVIAVLMPVHRIAQLPA